LEDIALLSEEKNILLVMKAGTVEITDETYRHHFHPRD